MDLSKHFILLNGEPKTLQIAAIQWNGSNGYSVRFKKQRGAPIIMGVTRWFGSAIQNGKTRHNARC